MAYTGSEDGHKGNTEDLTLDPVLQYFILVENEEWKSETLLDLLKDTPHVTQVVVFCNQDTLAHQLTGILNERNISSSAVYGDKDLAEREAVFDPFHSGSRHVVVVSGRLASHTDFLQQASLIVNYDLPSLCEEYIHRVGRSSSSGRNGGKATAINFLTNKDELLKTEVEKFYNTRIMEMPENIAEIF